MGAYDRNAAIVAAYGVGFLIIAYLLLRFRVKYRT